MCVVRKLENEAFQFLYSMFLEHSCNYPGCKTVLVVDGNLKNRRDVCAAREAGFIMSCLGVSRVVVSSHL